MTIQHPLGKVLNNQNMLYYNMPLEGFGPLDAEEFDALLADLDKGQTKEQQEYVAKALSAKEVPTEPM